jgi:hypothetical protein
MDPRVTAVVGAGTELSRAKRALDRHLTQKMGSGCAGAWGLGSNRSPSRFGVAPVQDSAIFLIGAGRSLFNFDQASQIAAQWPKPLRGILIRRTSAPRLTLNVVEASQLNSAQAVRISSPCRRRHERSDLDLAQPRLRQRRDPAVLVGMTRLTLCRPSRGPTSLTNMSMRGSVSICGSISSFDRISQFDLAGHAANGDPP